MKIFPGRRRDDGRIDIEAQMPHEEYNDLRDKWEKEFLKALNQCGYRPIRYEGKPVWDESIKMFVIKGTARAIQPKTDNDN